MSVLFETQVTNIGGRSGKAFSPDQTFKVDIAPPKELSGKETTATNPEQLFAAGFSSCFNSALELILKREKVKYESSTITAVVSLLQDTKDNGYKIGVRLQASIKGISLEEAKKYVALAHTVCPYSKATRGNIDVELEVV